MVEIRLGNVRCTYIAVHNIAIFLIRLCNMCLCISREALKAMSIYFIYYTIWSIIDSHVYIKMYTIVSENMVTQRLTYLMCIRVAWP